MSRIDSEHLGVPTDRDNGELTVQPLHAPKGFTQHAEVLGREGPVQLPRSPGIAVVALPLVIYTLDDLAVGALEELRQHGSVAKTLVPSFALDSFENALDPLDVIGIPRPAPLGQHLRSCASGEPKRRFEDLQIIWIIGDLD